MGGFDLLAAEVPAVESIGAQLLPEDLFGFGHVLAQLLCPVNLRVGHALSDDDVTRHSPSQTPQKGKGAGGKGRS